MIVFRLLVHTLCSVGFVISLESVSARPYERKTQYTWLECRVSGEGMWKGTNASEIFAVNASLPAIMQYDNTSTTLKPILPGANFSVSDTSIEAKRTIPGNPGVMNYVTWTIGRFNLNYSMTLIKSYQGQITVMGGKNGKCRQIEPRPIGSSKPVF